MRSLISSSVTREALALWVDMGGREGGRGVGLWKLRKGSGGS